MLIDIFTQMSYFKRPLTCFGLKAHHQEDTFLNHIYITFSLKHVEGLLTFDIPVNISITLDMIAVRKDGKININNMNHNRTLTYHLIYCHSDYK
jgi:hypothetical protein